MGTWDLGPFDNDTAADWCNDLDDAAPEQREPMIRTALTVVLDQGYLDSDFAVEAIAAAAVIASQRPGGAPITSAYGPDFLREGGTLDLPTDLDDLAVRALDRIVGDESEWRGLWEDAGRFDELRAQVETTRTVLAG